jgi:hypothetical protein
MDVSLCLDKMEYYDYCYITVLVTTVTITSAGDNNVVDIVEGETQTFTCTTDSSRPVAWIQWYIGGQNVTNQAALQPSQQDEDTFISSSILVCTGRDVNHNKVVFCEAVNIEGDSNLNVQKSLYIYNVSIIYHTVVVDQSLIVTFIKLLHYEMTSEI